jgi:phage gpG-like protein
MALGTIDVELVGLKEQLEKLKAGREQFLGAVRARMQTAVEILVGAVQTELSKGPRDVLAKGRRLDSYRFPKNPTKHLRVRTGRLRASVAGRVLQGNVAGRVVAGGSVIEGRVGPQRTKYALIHELGGTIVQHPQSRLRVFFRIDKDGRSRFSTKRRSNFEQRITYGTRTITIPPRPYVGPAIEAKRKAVIEQLGLAFDVFTASGGARL